MELGELARVEAERNARIREGAPVPSRPTTIGKTSIVVSVSPSLTGRFCAIDPERAASATVGGKGGGRSDMAQAGRPDGTRAGEALAAVGRFALPDPSETMRSSSA